ncbi:tRNA-splicing endonuclease subunit Sen2 [Trichonephila inaurata madagascariensis]|uniref:tRNA-intron lyase n=1 Tax=Trichonephila inaurata madagascariensis TaxID=2747483 RepID=A0A8X6WVJ5_9ARAC|nr:tRNA-splicing endonuclease subunit Sen2 [Trichonephila inaurata madagascariensis]
MEENYSLLLKPSAKKNSKFKRCYAFPIVTEDWQGNGSDPNWKIAEGYLQENCVLVQDEESMRRLYNMSFYGKGTLSKNAPQVCLKNKKSKPPRKKQKIEPTESVEDVIEVSDSDDEDTLQNGENQKDANEASVFPDSDDESHEYSKEYLSNGKESLQLTFQEAYFLSYGFGCLIVKDKDKFLSLVQLWSKMCELSPNFPVMYTAYHHFRSKGWIVKSGIKFGADYVLYKDGPPFYHATYSVLVRTLKENLKDIKGVKDLTWFSLAALNRVNSTAGKGLLILYVIKPNTMTDTQYSSPSCVSKFKLEEVLYKRWVASENREEAIECLSVDEDIPCTVDPKLV